ncbi:MAG: hypothetical protein JWM21_1172 [Acidobacteria bacterium]|nr:hypothetical protein [Acidobacteriota bacterium]
MGSARPQAGLFLTGLVGWSLLCRRAIALILKNRKPACLVLLLSLANFTGNARPKVTNPGAGSPARTPNISIAIVQPVNNGLTGNDLTVAVTVSSTFELQSVKANVDGRETALVFTTSGPCEYGCPAWTGIVSLAGLTRGAKVLTVTATDVMNGSAQAQQNFIHDQRPTLTVTAPLAETVARPALHLTALCTDDDPAGCSSITVTIDGSTIAGGQSSVDVNVSLAAYDGRHVTIRFDALDTRNQLARISRPVFVEAGDKLTEVETVSGSILDAQRDRILFLETTDGANVLKIRDRNSGQDTLVLNDPTRVSRYGFLTSPGAIFVTQRLNGSSLTDLIYEWRDGALQSLGNPNSSSSLKVRGDFAIWSSGQHLIRRDLRSGTNTEVATIAGNFMNDVTAAGDVVFWSSQSPTNFNIYRYSAGSTTQLTSDSVLWNTYTLTDGINVIYRKGDPCCSNQTFSIVMKATSGEIILAPPRSTEPNPGTDYQVNEGWAAFTRLGTGGQRQVWTRSPDGIENQLSFFGTTSTIGALGPAGELTFLNGGRTYLARANQSPANIASDLGVSFARDGHWYVTIGRSLFLVTDPSVAPTLVTEPQTTNLIALDSVNLTRDPFPIINRRNFSADQRTRVTLFVDNLNLLAGENAAAINVQAEDPAQHVYALPVEYFGKVPNYDWLTQVTVKLPDELTNAATVSLSITVRGSVSNKAVIRIVPAGSTQKTK